MSENPTPPPSMRIQTFDEVVQVVPYLLGFEPEQSLVALVLRDKKVEVTARADLADVTMPDQAEELLTRLADSFPGLQGVHLIAYTDDPAAGWGVLRRGEQHLGGLSLTSMLVNGDTWYTADGHSGAVDRYGAVAANAAFAGLPRLASRTELVQALASPPETGQQQATLAAAINTAPAPSDVAATLTSTAQMLHRQLAEPGQLSDTDAAQLAVLVHHPEARNLALLELTDAATAQKHTDLWCQVVRQVPADAAHVPLGLAGMAAWVSGNGALATVALERLEQIGGGNTALAMLLDDINTHVVPPSHWPPLRDRLLSDVHPLVRSAVNPDPAPSPVWETVQPTTGNPEWQPPSMTDPPRPGPAI